MDDARLLWKDLYGLAHDHVRIAALETRLAGESLVDMVAAGILAGLLVGTAWLGALASAVLALIESGMEPYLAILLSVVLNLVLALTLRAVIRSKSQSLQFPATVRLMGKSSPRQHRGVTDR